MGLNARRTRYQQRLRPGIPICQAAYLDCEFTATDIIARQFNQHTAIEQYLDDTIIIFLWDQGDEEYFSSGSMALNPFSRYYFGKKK